MEHLASKSCLLLGRVTDLKDRSLAEHNFERVNYMSILYLVVLTAAGLAQVQLPVIPVVLVIPVFRSFRSFKSFQSFQVTPI
jgi:hypothetical protein